MKSRIFGMFLLLLEGMMFVHADVRPPQIRTLVRIAADCANPALTIVVTNYGRASLTTNKEGVYQDGVLVRWVAPADWTVYATNQPVHLQIDGFAECLIDIDLGDRVSFDFDCDKELLNLRADPSNKKAIVVDFSDGAELRLHAGAVIHGDFLKDKTYFVRGHGGVDGVTADGKAVKLDDNTLPMLGGPLVEVVDKMGKHLARLSPVVPVRVSMVDGSPEAHLVVGEQEMDVKVGDEVPFLTANGSRIKITYSVQNEVKWIVEKGDFSFTVVGVPVWKAYGLTEQQATITWNSQGQAVDIRNQTPNQLLYVAVANEAVATVNPGTLFQVEERGGTFAMSATGGATLSRGGKTEQLDNSGTHTLQVDADPAGASTATGRKNGGGGGKAGPGTEANNTRGNSSAGGTDTGGSGENTSEGTGGGSSVVDRTFGNNQNVDSSRVPLNDVSTLSARPQ